MSFRRQRYLSFIFTFFVERWIAAVPTCAASLVDKVGLIHPHKRTRALNPVMKIQFLQVHTNKLYRGYCLPNTH